MSLNAKIYTLSDFKSNLTGSDGYGNSSLTSYLISSFCCYCVNTSLRYRSSSSSSCWRTRLFSSSKARAAYCRASSSYLYRSNSSCLILSFSRYFSSSSYFCRSISSSSRYLASSSNRYRSSSYLSCSSRNRFSSSLYFSNSISFRRSAMKSLIEDRYFGIVFFLGTSIRR